MTNYDQLTQHERTLKAENERLKAGVEELIQKLDRNAGKTLYCPCCNDDYPKHSEGCELEALREDGA
jgi:hypothetical protein